MTGQFSATGPATPGQPLPGQQGYQPQGYPQTGGYPQVPSGAFPQVQQSPASMPPLSGSVPIIPAPIVAIEEEAKASRVVYGLSGTAAGGIAGVVLGVLNTVLEGQTITQGADFIFDSMVWFAFIVGLLAFLKPEKFDYALMRLTNRDDDDDETGAG